jgi:hypothetical protein
MARRQAKQPTMPFRILQEPHKRGTKRNLKGRSNTYNTGDSLVVTDPTTNPALRSLTKGERTGPRVLYELWSYVIGEHVMMPYEQGASTAIHTMFGVKSTGESIVSSAGASQLVGY